MTESSQWFLGDLFQATESRAQHKHGSGPDYVSTAWHWLQMHISDSPVKLLVCCLYQCFVSPVEHQLAPGKVHAKSITRFLRALLLKEQLPSWRPQFQVEHAARGNYSLSLSFGFGCVMSSLLRCYSLNDDYADHTGICWKTSIFLENVFAQSSSLCFMEDSLSHFDVFPY